MSAEARDAKHYVVVWVALVVLAAVSFGLSGAHLGAWGLPAAFAIAAAKGALVVLFFMHIARMRGSVLLATLVAATLFALLVGLMTADVRTRAPAPLLPREAPARAP